MPTIQSSKILFFPENIYKKVADKQSGVGRYLTAALKPTATISVQSW
jgi:hypothetical protein